MKKTKWFRPYAPNTNGTLRPTMAETKAATQSGVYFIRRIGSKRPMYVGQSQTQLKKTIYRHFQQWTDRQQTTYQQFERTTYPKTGYEVRFIKCTPAQALRLEKFFIRSFQPVDNPIKYKKVEPAEEKATEPVLEKYLTAEELNPDVFLVDF